MWLNDHSGLPFKDQVIISEPWHMIFKFMIREGSLSQESKTAVHWLLGQAIGWEGHRLYQDRCALLSRGGQTWHFYRCIFLVSRLEAWKRNIIKRFDGDQALSWTCLFPWKPLCESRETPRLPPPYRTGKKGFDISDQGYLRLSRHLHAYCPSQLFRHPS